MDGSRDPELIPHPGPIGNDVREKRRLPLSLVDLWLLLGSSLGHATWNAISRSITKDRDRFYTVIMLIGLVIYGPFALGTIFRGRHAADVVGWVVGAAFFEMAYFLCLAKAYEQDSFLSAYPIARGSSPLITAILSVLIFRIPLSRDSMVGVGLVAMGIFGINQTSLSGKELRRRFANQGTLWALLTGFCTASYTICYAQSVSRVPPLLLICLVLGMVVIGRVTVERVTTWRTSAALASATHRAYLIGPNVLATNEAATPLVLERTSYLTLLKEYPLQAIAGGVLMFGVTTIVVYTMRSVNVALVATVREFSIVFAAGIGIFWLRESVTWYKAIAICLIVMGVVLVTQ